MQGGVYGPKRGWEETVRLIDADALFDVLYHAWGAEMDAGPASEFMEMINNAPTITPQPNEPLTLEELRQMDGEPVWIEVILPRCGNDKEWALVFVGGGFCRTSVGNIAFFALYGQTWLAYRRKPEEAK